MSVHQFNVLFGKLILEARAAGIPLGTLDVVTRGTMALLLKSKADESGD